MFINYYYINYYTCVVINIEFVSLKIIFIMLHSQYYVYRDPPIISSYVALLICRICLVL